MMKAVQLTTSEQPAADQGYLPKQTQPRKRVAQQEAEIELRPLPIELSEEERRAVDAKVADYKTNKKFKVDIYSRRGLAHRIRLMQAIFTGDTIDFYALVSLRADLNKLSSPQTLSLCNKHDKQWTPLMMASYKGHLPMVDFLLRSGVNVNHQSHFGYTAWSLAQGEKCKEIQQLLVEHGADPTLRRKIDEQIMRERVGETENFRVQQLPDPPLSTVFALKEEPQAVNPNEEEQKAVLAKVEAYKSEKRFNANGNHRASLRTHLVQAIFDRDIISFLALLLLGANANKMSTHVGGHADNHWTPLMMASHRGSLRMVKELLKRRVCINLQSHLGYSALMLAARGNYPEVVKCLLRHGADHRLTGIKGFTALEMVTEHQEGQQTKNILKIHSDFQQKVKDANSSDLICFIASAPDLDEEEAMNHMVIHENSLNQANDHGCTPLHMAVGVGSISFTKALLARKVAVDVNTFTGGMTALHIAAAQGMREIVDLLIAAKANPFARDEAFKTAKDCVARGTPLYTVLDNAEREKMKTQTRALEEMLDVSVKHEGVYFSEESNRSSARAPSSQASSEKKSVQEQRFKC